MFGVRDVMFGVIFPMFGVISGMFGTFFGMFGVIFGMFGVRVVLLAMSQIVVKTGISPYKKNKNNTNPLPTGRQA